MNENIQKAKNKIKKKKQFAIRARVQSKSRYILRPLLKRRAFAINYSIKEMWNCLHTKNIIIASKCYHMYIGGRSGRFERADFAIQPDCLRGSV